MTTIFKIIRLVAFMYISISRATDQSNTTQVCIQSLGRQKLLLKPEMKTTKQPSLHLTSLTAASPPPGAPATDSLATYSPLSLHRQCLFCKLFGRTISLLRVNRCILLDLPRGPIKLYSQCAYTHSTYLTVQYTQCGIYPVCDTQCAIS